MLPILAMALPGKNILMFISIGDDIFTYIYVLIKQMTQYLSSWIRDLLISVSSIPVFGFEEAHTLDTL